MAGNDPDRPLLVRVGRTKPVRWIDRRLATRRVGKAIAWSMIAGLVIYLVFSYEGPRARGTSLRDEPIAGHVGFDWLLPNPAFVSFTLIVGGGTFALVLFVLSEVTRRAESGDETDRTDRADETETS